ncbi:MAG: haloacid dehalogenase type II [Rubrobacteraceae bacterium]|nr:haloacid dehalogenase type II [Rubrobacteraceae bacterium]
MPETLAFDIYGTLVDPLKMEEKLEPFAGEKAGHLAKLWREKQLEYTFRRALMRRYEDFGVCTRQALAFATQSVGLELSREDERNLISAYQSLPAFEDALPGLRALRSQGHEMSAFSNGVEESARKVLEQAGLFEYLNTVISADEVKSFKPDPEVYRNACERLGGAPEEVWLVSSNPFDVIGAKSFGMRAVWVRRDPKTLLDPWGIEPDLVVRDLLHLAKELG